MRLLKFACALAFATICAASDTAEIGIKIIANPSVRTSSLSRDDLSRIFLMTKASLEGTGHVEPVLERSSPASHAFLRAYIGRTEAALMAYYRSLVFTGKGTIPKTFASDSATAAYVARTKGAIGFVSADTAAPGVKTLQIQ
ncbi:MAG TPA: hypothetical protein VKX25_01000 [Bryobacteraceae bacterium]|jgi:ABC-type phosphate transport system substrate-binding protein|nr:hypothetical protein [Bryobacteraceae bacterium]